MSIAPRFCNLRLEIADFNAHKACISENIEQKKLFAMVSEQKKYRHFSLSKNNQNILSVQDNNFKKSKISLNTLRTFDTFSTVYIKWKRPVLRGKGLHIHKMEP